MVEDERFQKWVALHIEGSWEVENGPSALLSETVQVINGLASHLVGCPLYTDVPDDRLLYPAAENTHRYQDAHRELYGFIVDGVSKGCIELLANRAGKAVRVGDKTTLKALYALFPGLDGSDFGAAMSLVAEQRRQASHRVRPPAKQLQAFSQFTGDLHLCVSGLKQLLAELERTFGVDGTKAYERIQAMKRLPRIARPAAPHYSICRTELMVGKQVQRVEYGFRDDIPGVHGSEVLMIHFTDGSMMATETGSNAQIVAKKSDSVRSEHFHVDFMVHWVPERPQGL